MKIRPRTKEDELREKIPTIDDVSTLYRPEANNLMIVPLPDQSMTDGGIILPDRSKTIYYEGHIVFKGPHCQTRFENGDCVTFNPSSGNLFAVDDNAKFWLVPDNQILMRISRSELTADRVEPKKMERCEMVAERRDK